MPGRTEGRGQLAERPPWRRWQVGNRGDGCGLRRAKLCSRLSQWQLLAVVAKTWAPSAAPPPQGKGVSPGIQTQWLALPQTSRPQAGTSPQRGAQLSGRINRVREA